ncbi:class I histocompatibility antigen, Non-RT1.A alpha-1 chain-like [Pongo abelii]|uniref:class I histocompatibility antigen, Non-RT1.A alpha-1 chain-like n=1 Tax=Pongo abelii TaxID=9601 RepID=UPI003006BE61
MSLNEDLQTWTAVQRAAWRIQRTSERFWTGEATREAPMCHCTRWLLRHLEHGKEMMLPSPVEIPAVQQSLGGAPGCGRQAETS